VQLEARLESLCAAVREAVLRVVSPPKLEALVLGGGYGRGQGGVLRTPVGDDPYNDLEFYVFVRGNQLLNETRYRRKLLASAEALSQGAGLHVEFKVDSLELLRHRPVSIFSYDLVSAHRVIEGEATWFRGCERHLEAKQIVSSEATRLLLNRCSGLLLAQERLARELNEEDCDFIGRNVAKAKLAMGDAILALLGQYHWDCLERAERLRALELPEAGELLTRVRRYHAAGVTFKLRPVRQVGNARQLKEEHREVTELALEEWLWIENRRLRASFANLREYAFSPVHKCPESGAWRNLLLNVKAFGPKASLDRYAPLYPRERLLNTLPLLLTNDPGDIEPETGRCLRRQLRTRSRDWHGLVAAYKQVWSCYG
jgi:hypothetical protein